MVWALANVKDVGNQLQKMNSATLQTWLCNEEDHQVFTT